MVSTTDICCMIYGILDMLDCILDSNGDEWATLLLRLPLFLGTFLKSKVSEN